MGIENVKLDRVKKGWPDRCFFLPKGNVWLVEFKRPLGRVSTYQKAVHKLLDAMGHTVSVLDDVVVFKYALATRLDEIAASVRNPAPAKTSNRFGAHRSASPDS
jgi:hypothetical protein